MNKMKAVIGIDPGVKGAIALINGLDRVTVKDFPGDFSLVYKILDEWDRLYNIQLVIIEKVSSTAIGGKKANFGFGKNAGVYEGICLAMELPYLLVLPREWQKVTDKKSGKTTKERSTNTARKLFPHIDLGNRKTADRADALNISYYGWTRLLKEK